MTQKIPATVITGFLGAGKTTLIHNLLTRNGGKRIALIINEFGDIGVDAEVLRGCGEALCADDDIIELSNGCICCTVADDFVPTMKQLLDRDLPPGAAGDDSEFEIGARATGGLDWPRRSGNLLMELSLGFGGISDVQFVLAWSF